MRLANQVRRAYWRLRRRTIYGVMVLAITPDGKLVLVRQTYSPGWALPGGGRRPTEDPATAALRELREEIGLTGWTEVNNVVTLDRPLSGVPASIDLIQVQGVEFTFRPNLEIETAGTFDPSHLPADLNPWSAHFIEAGSAVLEGAKP